MWPIWRGAGVADQARLESVCRGNLTVGSNPTLSAISPKSKTIIFEFRFLLQQTECQNEAYGFVTSNVRFIPITIILCTQLIVY